MKRMRFQKVAMVAASASLGAGAALVVGACGEERGSVEVEGSTGTTGTTGAPGATGTTSTTSTSTTQTTPPPVDGTGTSPPP